MHLELPPTKRQQQTDEGTKEQRGKSGKLLEEGYADGQCDFVTCNVRLTGSRVARSLSLVNWNDSTSWDKEGVFHFKLKQPFQMKETV